MNRRSRPLQSRAHGRVCRRPPAGRRTADHSARRAHRQRRLPRRPARPDPHAGLRGHPGRRVRGDHRPHPAGRHHRRAAGPPAAAGAGAAGRAGHGRPGARADPRGEGRLRRRRARRDHPPADAVPGVAARRSAHPAGDGARPDAGHRRLDGHTIGLLHSRGAVDITVVCVVCARRASRRWRRRHPRRGCSPPPSTTASTTSPTSCRVSAMPATGSSGRADYQPRAAVEQLLLGGGGAPARAAASSPVTARRTSV